MPKLMIISALLSGCTPLPPCLEWREIKIEKSYQMHGHGPVDLKAVEFRCVLRDPYWQPQPAQ